MSDTATEPESTTYPWQREHAARLRHEKQLLIERLGLPTNAVGFRGALEQTIAMRALAGDFTFLLLTGNPGTGKTFAAVRWILEYVNRDANWTEPGSALQLRGRPPLWTTGPTLSRWDHFGREQMAKLFYSPRLVIDDMGTEFLDKSGFYTSLLDEVFNERYCGRRPIVITTNLDVEGFRARYGVRIADRIRECGKVIGCGTQSLRRPAPRA